MWGQEEARARRYMDRLAVLYAHEASPLLPTNFISALTALARIIYDFSSS